MGFREGVQARSRLKRRRVIRDYVIIGAVAYAYHAEPVATQDMNVVVLVGSDDEYLTTFRRLREESERLEGMHLYFGGVPVQLFPSSTKPLYEDTLVHGKRVRLGNARVTVADRERLILLYLEALRPQDRVRIVRLLEHAAIGRIRALLRRFDDERDTLAARFRELYQVGYR